MKINDLKIKTQLRIGIVAILLLVIVLGYVSYRQSDQIHQQTETMYQHPLKTRRILGEITDNVLCMRVNMRDFLLLNDAKARQTVLNDIAINQANVQMGIEQLYLAYLGPRTDIDHFYREYTKWRSIRDETVRIVSAGRLEEGKLRHVPGGIAPTQAINVLKALQKISDFAESKGDLLYENSVALQKSLNRQLFLLAAVILLLSFLINYILYRNIRTPLIELHRATQSFQEGNMDTRSSYHSKNEFGVLSASFNALAENIQVKKDLDEKFTSLATFMMSEYDTRNFFHTTLNILASYTNSQLAAIYLLSSDKKTFNHFESTGVDDNARKSFAADSFEGEFGSALSLRQVQHIKNIPEDTRFIFYTVSGKFIPNEILTLPILSGNEVIAVISLATVSTYSKQSIQLIDNILFTLSARIEGILSFHKIKEFSEKLSNQNSELEAQKTELAMQSAELTEQNTELEMQKKQLSEASKLKTSFLSNMSHELRTPLNSVIALTGVLNRRLSKKIPDEEHGYLEVIERNGRHLLSLINDILDISRIEAGHEEMEITAFSMDRLIGEVVSMIQPQAKQKNIKLLHKSVSSELLMKSDAGKCRHILQNLFDNAVKFTEKGKVEISAVQNDDQVIITVSDTGIGIPENYMSHIFDEFRQADSSTSRKYGGTGLGLAIAQKFAKMLGGVITAKSTIGKGSEFTLTLPLRYDSDIVIRDEVRSLGHHDAITPLPEKPASDTSVKTILLVEDSEPAIIQIKDFLEGSGYRILLARDGSEALGIIAHTIPDAMILDLMMPVTDGFKVLKSIREAGQTAHLPVLILTAKHITKEELAFLKQNHIHQLIQKGDVNRDELLKAVYTMVHPFAGEAIKQRRKMSPAESKPVVLVIEDNPDNMLTTRVLLTDEFTVIEAADAMKGIELAGKHKPDLILMDIELPGMDGIEAFKAIRNDIRLQDIPVIALTASAMSSERETILAHGFDAYIAKPFDEHLFFKTIREILYGT